MPPHHVLLEFHHSLFGSLSGLFKLVQDHITLLTKGMPRLLKVMSLEHLYNSLIHHPQQRYGDRWQEDKLDVRMQVRQHLGVGGSVVKDHQHMEGEALRRAILLQLMHQLYLAVGMENMACHPTTGVGKPVDRQAGLIIALDSTRVLSTVDQDEPEFAVSLQVSSQQQGEMVLEHFEARGRLLLPRDVCAFRHLLLLQAHFIHVKNLLWGLCPHSSMMALRRSG